MWRSEEATVLIANGAAAWDPACLCPPCIRATEYIACSLWIEATGDCEGVYSMRDELAIKMNASADDGGYRGATQ